MVLDSLTASPVVVTSVGSSDGGGGTALALLLLMSGFLFYSVVYLRYRNVDQRHRHESETFADIHDVTGYDQYRSSLKGVQTTRIEGVNNHQVRGVQNTVTHPQGYGAPQPPRVEGHAPVPGHGPVPPPAPAPQPTSYPGHVTRPPNAP